MKRILIVLSGILASLAAAAGTLPADTNAAPAEAALPERKAVNLFAGQTEVKILSSYVWRGQIICDRPVVQPAQNLYVNFGEYAEYGTLKQRVWADFYINGNKGPHRFGGMSIVDATTSYTKTFFDSLDTEIGHIWYWFPNRKATGMRDTDEFLAGLQWRNPILTPRVYAWWDYAKKGRTADNQLFFDFDFTHPFKLTDTVSLVPGSGFGVANGPYMKHYSKGTVDRIAFNYFHHDLGLYWQLAKWLKVGAELSYIYNWDRNVRHSAYNLRSDYNCGILRGGFSLIATY